MGKYSKLLKPENYYFKDIELSKEIVKEIEDYKNFITNPLSCYENIQILQKKSTFNRLSKNNIKYFCKYLNSQHDIKLENEKSLLPFILKYLIDYMKYLYTKNPTETVFTLTRIFPNMVRNYYRVDFPDDLTNEIKKLKRLPVHSPYLSEKLYLYNSYSVPLIVKKIDSISNIKAKLILNLLVYMGWRSANIMMLTINKNIYKKGNIWYYVFKPEEQKYPLKLEGLMLDIKGSFPKHIGKILDEYITTVSGNKLFIREDGKEYHSSWLNTYVKKKCVSIGLDRLSPHSFRSIISQRYFDETHDFITAETWLWHKLKFSSAMINYIRPNYDLAVKRIGEFLESQKK